MIKMEFKLVPPCTYQGGKQRLAKKIVDIIFEQNDINENTKFYDLCCGSGAITLELINRGIHPSNITMVDYSDYGLFWNMIANDEFELNKFKNIVDEIPNKEHRKEYLLKKASHFNDENRVYDYLILQSGSFGGKALWSDNNKWHHHGFRDYWMPTETSVRRSPCNPTHPEPSVMYERLKNIVDVCGGNIRALHMDVRDFIKREVFGTNSIIYIDPEYKGTTGYKTDSNKLDVIKDVVEVINTEIPIYISECNILSDKYEFIAKGKSKGNITGIVKTKRKDDLLNIFNVK